MSRNRIRTTTHPSPGSRETCLLCVSVLLVPALLSGCLYDVGQPAEVLVLTYTQTAAPDAEPREASGGAHCATASIGGGFVRVQRSAHERIGSPYRLLYVDPELVGRWVTLGDEAFVLGFPAEIGGGVAGTWSRIDLHNDSRVLVDGAAVTLPHEWSVVADDASWRIDARLEAGPPRVKEVKDQMCA